MTKAPLPLQRLQQGKPPSAENSAALLERLRRFGLLVQTR